MSAPARRGATLLPLEPFAGIGPGDDLVAEILNAAQLCGVTFADTDIIVVAQKVVSKAEGRIRELAGVDVTDEARDLAGRTGKDPRIVTLVLEESRTVLRALPDVLIVETHAGHIAANAGIDESNVAQDGPDGAVALLLPEDADASAREIRAGIERATGKRPGIIVSDSFGRPWRFGTAGVAIGVAGPPMVIDLRGTPDLFGRILKISEIGFADSVAGAAVLVMGEAAEGTPVVLVRGLEWAESGLPSASGLRPREKDLFR